MVFVARLTVDGPFHKGLLRNIQLSQTVDYDMHMDIAAAVVTVHVGADQRLMPRKVGFYIFHADGLRLFTCQFTLVFVGRIEADEVVVRLDFIVILILVVLRIKHFALHIKKFRLTVYHCSAWFFYLLGSVLLATAILSYLMHQSQGMEALQMLIGGFVIFMIPQVVGGVVVLLELAAVMLRQVWYI